MRKAWLAVLVLILATCVYLLATNQIGPNAAPIAPPVEAPSPSPTQGF